LVLVQSLLDPPALGDIGECCHEPTVASGVGTCLVSAPQRRGGLLEAHRLALEGHAPIAFDPDGLQRRYHLKDRAPDDVARVQAGELLECGVHLQETVVARTP
jgi:hypothetical protein